MGTQTGEPAAGPATGCLSHTLSWVGAGPSQDPREDPLWAADEDRTEGAPPASAPLSRRHSPCPGSEQPAQGRRLAGDRALSREAVCCLQRQETHFLRLQLCPVKNPALDHSPLPPFRGSLNGFTRSPDPKRADVSSGEIPHSFSIPPGADDSPA